MFKKIIASILCFCMLTTVVSAASFTDVTGHWADEEITYAVNNGIVNGYPDGTFKPNNTVTRAEFVKMLVAAIIKNLDMDISEYDDGTHWVAKYYNFAVQNGVVVPQPDIQIDGVPIGTLNTANSGYDIKRWEMAYMLYCVLVNIFAYDEPYYDYADYDKTQQLYGGDIASLIGTCVSVGLLRGDQNGNINAANNTTRAEAVTVVNRVDRLIKDVMSQQDENVKTYDDIPTGTPKVEFTMENGGTFTVELYPEYAPQTVANFVALAESGFYNGLTFHRIIEGFMAQGGDPNGDGTGGADWNIIGEFAENGFTENTLKHERGIISMARSNDLNSASSQFFICYDSASHLDGNYAAFGKVISGMDVIDSFLEEGELDDNGQLVLDNPIVIKEAKVIE